MRIPALVHRLPELTDVELEGGGVVLAPFDHLLTQARQPAKGRVDEAHAAG
jgi:hypothetical protein